MVERVIERGKEPEPKELYYDIEYKWREAWVQKMKESPVVIRGRDISWEQNRQGLLKFYLNRGVWDKLGIPNWNAFIHQIKRHSGKHKHKGGVIIYVLEGTGYTVVNGVRWDWKAGDLLILPINPEGNEHQHFNTDPSRPAFWAAFIWQPFYQAVGMYVQQKETSPDWSGSLLPDKPHVS